MEFTCYKCGFTTGDEDEILYCDYCGRTMCVKCTVFVQHQGFEEAKCGKC